MSINADTRNPILTDSYLMSIDRGVGVIETRCRGPRNTVHIAPLTWMGSAMFGLGEHGYLVTFLELEGQMTHAGSGTRDAGARDRISLCMTGTGQTETAIFDWVKKRIMCNDWVAKSFTQGILDYLERIQGRNETNNSSNQR